MGNDVNVTSFLKVAQQFFVCEYFLLILVDIPSFKFIEGQIKELQGVVPNRAENDPGRIGLNTLSEKDAHWSFELRPYGYLNLTLSSLPLSPVLTNRQVDQN